MRGQPFVATAMANGEEASKLLSPGRWLGKAVAILNNKHILT